MQNSEHSPCGGEKTRCTLATPEEVHLWLKTGANQLDPGILKWISEIDREELRHYSARLFRDCPVFASWGIWLTAFCTAFPPAVEYDTAATTFGHCGIVLLGALLADSRSTDLLAQATSLPKPFVKMTLGLADQICLWISCNGRTLRRHLVEGDSFQVYRSMSALTEEYWLAIPAFARDVLMDLRAGCQFDGDADDWTEAEDVSWTG